MAVHHYTYFSVLEAEDQMLSDLAALLAQHGIQNPQKYSFMLSVSEAFTNALMHGNNLDPSKKIKLSIEIKPNQLYADITDEGCGGLERIAHKKHSEVYDEGGRGVDLIRHYATSVEFNEAVTGGITVTVIIDREQEQITK